VPISKAAAADAAVNRDAEAINDLQDALDRKIEECFGTDERMSVPIKGVPAHVVKRVQATYEAFGWTVNVELGGQLNEDGYIEVI